MNTLNDISINNATLYAPTLHGSIMQNTTLFYSSLSDSTVSNIYFTDNIHLGGCSFSAEQLGVLFTYLLAAHPELQI